MTIQQKHDALLVFLVEATKATPGANMASIVSLEADDKQQALDRCGLADQQELVFFVESLARRGMLVSHATLGGGINFQITMEGYERAEELCGQP
jgi:hypothetical protein